MPIGSAAAAATVSNRHRNGSTSRPSCQNAVKEVVDPDYDGSVGVEQMKRYMDILSVRADLMHSRLVLEGDLTVMMSKLPNFFLCVITFVLALVEFSPPASTSDLQSHIKTHFELDKIKSITDFDGLYTYMENFEHKNEELQATSVKFWCEDRYSTYTWDPDLLVPKWTCASPRQYALTLSTDSSWAWTHLHGHGSSNSGSHSSSGSSGHRRMASSSSGSDCVDDDAGLQEAESDSSLTCATYHHACDMEVGVHYCLKTCGYCRPFKYNNIVRFDKPQVTILPVMVYQTRFGDMDCHGFAETYNLQEYNANLWKLPPLDGHRHGTLLHCIDRTKHWEEEYAKEVDCPASVTTSKCSGGTMSITKVHTFHGLPIYPKMLLEPHHDIEQMKAVEWLDLKTESVSLSTMIYTENIEVFTSLTVTFSMSLAGNIDGSYTEVSYSDMVKGSKAAFIACLILTILGSLFGVFLSLRHLMVHPEECEWGFTIYELISRSTLLVYALILLITWGTQVPMAEEYDHILHSFLDSESMEDDHMEDLIQSFFGAKTHLWQETSWLLRQMIAAYVVLYFQFLQLILYLSAHPKLGVLTATIWKAMSHLIHFLMLFWVLFLMLGFMAHWMLGEHLDGFGTFGDTIQSQGRMLFGEFIYMSGAEELTPGFTAMYWLYATTFMLVVFFTLLNFFLAIIVDAFVDVKSDFGSESVVGGFFTDVWRVISVGMRRRSEKWPARSVFIRVFEKAKNAKSNQAFMLSVSDDGQDEADDERPTILCKNLLEQVDGLTEDKLASFLAYYFGLEQAILCKA